MAVSFSKVKNLVLGSQLVYNSNKGCFDSVTQPIPLMRQYVKSAYVNVITDEKEQDKFRVSRVFSPTETVNDSVYVCFAAYIAGLYNPAKAKKFLDRNNRVEIINYRRPQTSYTVLQPREIFSPDLPDDIFKGKIVLLGFMGKDENDPSWADKFYTPMNEKFAGKSAPDLFGVFIHANIISMIMEEKYIDQLPNFMNHLLGVLICILNVWYFYYLNHNHNQWYVLVTKSIQFTETVLVLFVIVIVFDKFKIKMDLSSGISAIVLSGDLLEIYAGLMKIIIGNKRKNIVPLSN